VSSKSWSQFHPLSAADSPVLAQMRAMVEPFKGKLEGTAARGPFEGIMNSVPPPDRVTYRPDTVGGVPGWWCRPDGARSDAVILHLHGGWFNWGSAEAFRHLVGHIAARAGVEAFVPDYRLAPENPFPAAVEDSEACYLGLLERGLKRIAITGDSAGGNLALVLLSLSNTSANSKLAGGETPVCAVALSPVTDLALTSPSYETQAAADPYFTRHQVSGLVHSYLGGADPRNPLLSPLYGDLTGLPPIRVHVGEAEVLLDDSRRYVERAVGAGVDARLDVWAGMPHGFTNSLGRLEAAEQVLEAVGAFLAQSACR
jgi:monoterpene epsilon-lactone hydrolase